ncbi:MAG: von Willebrand factor type A domain-containing protein [Acidobacteriota bacterium]
MRIPSTSMALQEATRGRQRGEPRLCWVLALALAACTSPSTDVPSTEVPSIESPLPIEASPTSAQSSDRPSPPPLRVKVSDVPILAGRRPLALDPVTSAGAPMIDTSRANRLDLVIRTGTAAYALARSALDRRVLPAAAAIRVEDFANAFSDEGPPVRGQSLQVAADLFPSPGRSGFHILRIVLRGRAAPPRPLDIVAVVETGPSGLPKINEALTELVDSLDAKDRLGLVAWGQGQRVFMQLASVDDGWRIRRALTTLGPAQEHDLTASLQRAYEMLRHHPSPHRVRRILLFSDGRLRQAPTRAFDAAIRRAAEAGMTLSTLLIPISGAHSPALERVARHGSGVHVVIDNAAEAQRLMRRLAGDRGLTGLETVARSIVGQIELRPQAVTRYRPLGNPQRPRQHAALGASGVSMTAASQATMLYEIQLTAQTVAQLGTIRIDFRDAASDLRQQLALPLPPVAPDAAKSTAGLTWIAATFGERLAGSFWTQDIGYGSLLRAFEALDPQVRTTPQAAELRYLMRQARELERSGSTPPGRPQPPDHHLSRLRILE